MNPPGRIVQHLAVVTLIVGAGIYTFYKRPASRSEPVKAPAGQKAAVVPAVVTNADTPADLEARLLRGDLNFRERTAALEALAQNGSSAALEKLFTFASAIRSEDLKKQQLAGEALDALKTCFTMEVVDFLTKDLQQEERFSRQLTEAAAAIGHPKLAEALARRIAGPVDWDTKERLRLLRQMGPYGELLAVAVIELYPLPSDRLQRLPRPALSLSTPLLVEKVARSAAYRNKLAELAQPRPLNGFHPLTPQQFAALSEKEQQACLDANFDAGFKPCLGHGCSHLMGYPPYFKSIGVKGRFLLYLKAFGNRDALPWLQAELAAARQRAQGYPRAQDFQEVIAACDLDPGLLAQPDLKKRWAAIQNFSDRGDYRALPVILSELKGYRPTSNYDLFLSGVINALSNYRDPAAIEALTRLANSSWLADGQLKLLAEALGNIGAPACLPSLSAILPNEDASPAALFALGRIDTPESSKVIYDYFLLRQKKDVSSPRVACVWQLMRHRNDAARGYLLELMRTVDPRQYSDVARNLRERDPASTLSAIAKVISDMPPRPRQMLEIVRQSIEADQQARALGRPSTIARAGA